jgi:hypothetical protein
VIDLRPIEIQRMDRGLGSPFPEEKEEVWRNLTVVQANIRKETGGYRPISRVIEQAHFHPAMVKMTTGGIRGSKSLSMAMDMVTWLPYSDLQWLIGQTYEDSRQEFEYIVEACQSLDWISRVSWPQNRYQPCVMETKWGAVVETKAGADEQSLMSRAPDYLGLCEPGKMSFSVYRHAIERASTRRAQVWLAGTFENTAPWMEVLWKKWRRWPNEDHAKAWSSPTHSNRVIYPEGLKDPAYLRLKSTALFAQDPGQEAAGWDEYLRRLVGVPASSPEIIFSKIFKPREHVANVEWVRQDGDKKYLPVYAAIDPGYSGHSRYVVLAIQIIGKTIRVIDEVVAQQLNHQQVKALCAKREWWPFMQEGVIDPYAGNQHGIGGGSTPAEEWRRRDDNFGPVNVATPNMTGYRTRGSRYAEEIRLLSSYLTGINGWTIQIANRCERLRWELSTWKREKRNNILGEPEQRNNDAIKALIYFLVHHRAGFFSPERNESLMISDYRLTGSGVDPILAMQQSLAEEAAFNEVWNNERSSWIGV